MLAKAKEMSLDNLAGKKLPWIETLVITSPQPLAIGDVNDDLTRELAFYQQALYCAQEGKKRVLQAGISFTRPDDYFAEMLKSDEHMMRVRKHLVEEAQSIKLAEEAKRQRELKKFGKKVQTQRLLERQKQKSDTLEKISSLKRSKFFS